MCCVAGTNSVVDQLYFKNKPRKDTRLVVTRDGQWEEGELDEGSQRYFQLKDKSLEYNVQHDKCN